MQLFDPLYDTIVHKLIAQQGLSIQSLHKKVNEEITISLPNFYKIIDRLVKNWVIMKENGKLFLHNRWILGILELAEELKTVYTTDVTNVTQLLEGQSMIHEASGLKFLDGVWADRELSINRLYGHQEASYMFHSHPYYMLGSQETEIAFGKQISKIAPFYYLCANTNFLDTYGVELYKESGATRALASDKTPFLKDGYCITVVGDFVFEVLYPPEITDYLKIFFDTIKDIKDFNQELFQRIFNMKANCKLTLRRDKTHAEQVKRVFHAAFREGV